MKTETTIETVADFGALQKLGDAYVDLYACVHTLEGLLKAGVDPRAILEDGSPLRLHMARGLEKHRALPRRAPVAQ